MHGTHLRQAVAGPRAAKIACVTGDDERIERIRERAYLLWERAPHGEETEYWLQAEREIDAEAAPAAAPKATKKKEREAQSKSSGTVPDRSITSGSTPAVRPRRDRRRVQRSSKR